MVLTQIYSLKYPQKGKTSEVMKYIYKIILLAKSKRNTKVKHIVSKDIEGTHHLKDSLSFLYSVQLVVNFPKMYLKQQKMTIFLLLCMICHI